MRKRKQPGTTPKVGDLQVWWIPQVPGTPFEVDVQTLREARLILNVLGRYDIFQFENRIKPDYSNAGGLRIWSSSCDGNGKSGWVDWRNEDSDDFDDVPDEQLDTAVWEEA